MKRPQASGTKRAAAPRTPKADPLEDLKDRLHDAELDATFNPRTDETSLDELFTLLVDMTAAVVAHGVTPDEAFSKVHPKSVWPKYLEMWREQHLRVVATADRYAADDDEVFFHADALAAALERRERLAWRLLLCQRALGGEPRDRDLRARLEVLRVAKAEPRKRAA